MQIFSLIFSIFALANIHMDMITITHNIDPKKFKFFWTKYVREGDLRHHCAACVKGSWSKKFCAAWNKDNNDEYAPFEETITFDEFPEGTYKAIYICGVFKAGSSTKKNYPHNVHLAIVSEEGHNDVYDFEDWHIQIEGGRITRIPTEEELDERFFNYPYDHHHYTCRIFRWMVGFFYPELLKAN